jgi:hypothetical protein
MNFISHISHRKNNKYVCECGKLIKYSNRDIRQHIDSTVHKQQMTNNFYSMTRIYYLLPNEMKQHICEFLFESYNYENISYSKIYDCPKIKRGKMNGYTPLTPCKIYKDNNIYSNYHYGTIHVQGFKRMAKLRLINRDCNRVFESLPMYKNEKQNIEKYTRRWNFKKSEDIRRVEYYIMRGKNCNLSTDDEITRYTLSNLRTYEYRLYKVT